MSTGTGIFLGLLAIASVLLYRSTQDRWQWRRIAKRVGWAIVATVMLAFVIVGASIGYDSAQEWWQNRPRKLTEFRGVKLGSTQAEVLYRKGSPDEVLTGRGKNGNRKTWLFGSEIDGYTQVLFSERGRVFAVMTWRCVELVGVPVCGGTEEQLIAKLGQPDSFDTSPDGLRRLYRWEKWNVRAELAQGNISEIGISDQLVSYNKKK